MFEGSISSLLLRTYELKKCIENDIDNCEEVEEDKDVIKSEHSHILNGL